MKKKFLALVSVLLIFCFSLPTFALDLSVDGINQVVDRIYAIDSEKRETLFTLGAPLIITDNGVDSLINMVTKYENGTSSGMFDSFIEIALKYTDSDSLIRSLKSIKCVSPEIRQKYVDIFDRNVEMELSSSEAKAFDGFMDKTGNTISNLKPLINQFGISNKTIANLLGIFKEINGEPVFKFEKGSYKVNKVSQSFQNSLNNVWSGTGKASDLNKSFSGFASLLNSATTESERTSLNPLFIKVGLIKKIESPSENEGGSGSGAGGSGGSNAPATNILPSQNVEIVKLDKLEGISTEGTIYSVKIAGNSARVSLDAKAGDVLKKVTEDGLSIVKLSFNENGKIFAIINESANYVVEKATDMPFSDVSGWSLEYISSLYAKGIINGKTDDLFMPNESITREEFVKLVVMVFDLVSNETNNKFVDVKEGSWYYDYVLSAYNNAIVNGISETEFGVGQKIKRQDMAKIINSILEKNNIYGKTDSSSFNDFDTISDYAKDSVAKIKAFGIISGDENGNFNPNNFATRAEASKMIYGLIKTYVSNK